MFTATTPVNLGFTALVAPQHIRLRLVYQTNNNRSDILLF